jgi:hypothetical protein
MEVHSVKLEENRDGYGILMLSRKMIVIRSMEKTDLPQAVRQQCSKTKNRLAGIGPDAGFLIIR